jgi:hypothetical protein
MPLGPDSEIGLVIDRLQSALSDHGVELCPPQCDEQSEMLLEVIDQLDPWRLPDEVDYLWRTIDARFLRACLYPEFKSIDFMLSGWHETLQAQSYDSPMAPPRLFDIAYESHGWLYVELGIDDDPGGSIWGTSVGPGRLSLEARTLSERFALLCDLLDDGAYELRENPRTKWLAVDSAEANKRMRAANDALGPPTGHTATSYRGDAEWPDRWRFRRAAPLRE